MLKTPMIQEILPLRDKWKLAELNVGQVAFYAQDDWNINDDFKLTLGLRADKPLYFNTLI
jgi:outer membrane receptor protein involved in Fe transport